MTRLGGHQRGGQVLDDLAFRLRQMVRDVHMRDLSGVERMRVLSISPLRVAQVQGELALEDGDPDFTIGEGLRAQMNAGVVALGQLVWVARSDQEWHAFDTVGAGGGFGPTGAAGGDLGGNYPNPTVGKLQGRAVSSSAPANGQAFVWDGTSGSWKPTTLASSYPPSGAAGGDLGGNYPGPTVAQLQGRAVDAAAPSAGGKLFWDGTKWTGVRVAARAYRNTAFTVGTSAAKVAFDTIAFDPGGNFSTANGRYVCPVAGYYRVTAQILVDASASGWVALWLYKTGVAQSYAEVQPVTSSFNVTVPFNDEIQCAAGDYLEMWADANVSATGVAGGGTRMAVSLA